MKLLWGVFVVVLVVWGLMLVVDLLVSLDIWVVCK